MIKRINKNNKVDKIEEILEYCMKLSLYKILLKETIPDSQEFLDDEIIDKITFETIRQATEEERNYFYGIRRIELKIKELQKELTLPR